MARVGDQVQEDLDQALGITQDQGDLWRSIELELHFAHVGEPVELQRIHQRIMDVHGDQAMGPLPRVGQEILHHATAAKGGPEDPMGSIEPVAAIRIPVENLGQADDGLERTAELVRNPGD
jgi:hypothetical protein